ncbi:hypothetical protein CAPTEDRAFT_158712 [Capitella teleta]|uniref:Methylmalonic aciduria and homocystinuria type D protein, mitochondrial n=1 Tax=Capitella teleta TaxID=283909 RepID=R7UJS2_CAPTE|nr:hypothetical protein CAPTEDRAFT_158712 [Capitella teleta]|eukprot:ELU06358.1 hypothetical protein CAPTEDRAFT_158712 [Capitella teleta]
MMEWPDTRLGVLSPQDPRFPLPGTSGPDPCFMKEEKVQSTAEPDVLTEPMPAERRGDLLQQYMDMAEKSDVSPEMFEAAKLGLECVAQELPELLRKDFQDLFPEQDFRSRNLTVITLSQHTENNMTMWSPEVEEEREVMLENFVCSASDICTSLQAAGYWADFIDPSSGKPYLGPHTNSTLFETDERFRHFGFEINDLGCCKVISHQLWGSHSYVGCLFTNAPLDHPVISQLAVAAKE